MGLFCGCASRSRYCWYNIDMKKALKAKKSAKSKSLNEKLAANFRSHRRLWVVGLITIAAVVYYPTSIYLDKQKFVKAEAEIDKLSQQIQSKIGKADQVVKDNSCGYASKKFGRGQRGCSVRIDHVYYNKSTPEATDLMNSLSGSYIGEPYNYFDNGDGKFGEPSKTIKEESFSQEMSTMTSLSCSVYYVYRLAGEHADVPSTQSSENSFVVSLICSGNAKAEHFPVKD